jgi:hypothetical protein
MRTSQSKNSIGTLHGAGAILAPVMRIALAIGVSQRELLALCATCIQQANEQLPQRGKFKTIHRDPRYADIITRWYTCPSYLQDGKPARLRKSGRGQSFSTLVRDVEPELNPSEVLREWIELRIARRNSDGKIELRQRFIPTRVGRVIDLDYFFRTVGDFLRAHEFNLLNPIKRGDGLFERAATSWNVDRRLAPDFNAFARNQSALLLEAIDDWLARHEMPMQKRKRKPSRLGLGIYVINETLR